jgi:hypothetical protein
MSETRAVTFDDFFTLSYPIKQKQDIVYPILRALKREGVYLDDEEFLGKYFREDALCKKRLKETLCGSLLDGIVTSALAAVVISQRLLVKLLEKLWIMD